MKVFYHLKQTMTGKKNDGFARVALLFPSLFPCLKAGIFQCSFYRMMCFFLFDFKPLKKPFYLLERYLFHLIRTARSLEFHSIQQLFCGKDKTIFIIPEHINRILFLITEYKHIRFLERILFELHTDNCYKTRDLFSKIRDPACQKDVVSALCHPPHHNCFITRSSFSSASVRKSSGINSFIP